MTKLLVSDYLEENKKRHEKLFPEYDPARGIGSPIPRKEFLGTGVFLPVAMYDDPWIETVITFGGLDKFSDITGEPREDVAEKFTKIRTQYDFEFWALLTAKIKSKESNKNTAFIARPAQRMIIKELYEDIANGVPMRYIIVKARQWGSSTFFQVWMAWVQLIVKEGWSSVIVTDVLTQAANIRNVYKRIAKNYPIDMGEFELVPYEQAGNTKYLRHRDCIIEVGSMQRPDSLRSFNFSMAHLSETGLWKKTEGKAPEDVAQSVRASIMKKPWTLIALESTAKGVGNFFHREWMLAINGHSGYRPIFVPWFFIELYLEEVKDPEEFIKGWGDYEKFLWEQGATLEGIMWYINYQKSENYDDWRMQSEFPTTAAEAFQSTGRRAFDARHISRMRKSIKPPKYIGDIQGKSIKGPDALKDLEFVPNPNGSLKIWKKPEDLPMPDGKKMKNRFVAFADIGGRTEKADFSSISIFDRYWMCEGDVPERVASWHGHLDQDLFAWVFAQVCAYYEYAYGAIETNSLRDQADDTEGIHHYTILDEIADHYPNLYTRTHPERIREGIPAVWGFHTNHQTKGWLVDGYNAALRDSQYIEYDGMALDEADIYEIKENGKLGAVDGGHDDHLITTMGCVFLCYSEHAWTGPAKMIDTKRKTPRRKSTGGLAEM